MPPKVFIGSSSEKLDLAYAIQQNLDHDCEPIVWDQGIFECNSSILDNLVQTLSNMDFGIFVFAPDDITKIRDHQFNSIRDNVVFEFGLFIGHLGKERTFFVVPRNSLNNFRMPSDLAGIVPLTYDARRLQHDSQGSINYRAALGSACTSIRTNIHNRGSRDDKVEIIKTHKEVYAYIFNRLNPYQDITLSQDFLRNLPNTSLSKIDNVLRPLENLIHHYVGKLINSWMRVYFAYKLDQPIDVLSDNNSSREQVMTAYYRIGISFSADDKKWIEGMPVFRPSNINRVYTRKSISKVRNAKRQIKSEKVENQLVENEGSVIAFPILLADENNEEECIGVLAISSPIREEVTQIEYENLGDELSTLFSALFYAYGRHLLRSQTFEQVVEQLRREISEHYEGKFF